MTAELCKLRADDNKYWVDFNVDAFIHAASRATDGASCKSIIKISEDHYHKCYELLMRNGRRLVAKIPLPHVSIPHLTCANQVATMDFVSIHIPPYVSVASSQILMIFPSI